MRTTIDLPDELFREAKSRAALEGRSLKDLVEEALQRLLEKSAATLTKVAETEDLPIPPSRKLLKKRASAGAWARQFAGVAKPDPNEPIEEARMSHFREKYGVK